MSAGSGPCMRVLVVDDSALVRETTARLLRSEPDIEVDVAADPYIALDKMKRARPSVILLDLEMPRMDGLSFLHKVMTEDPIPVVVCSALTGQGTEAGLRALAEGAVAIVTKPKLGVRDFLTDSGALLIATLREAAAAKSVRFKAPTLPRGMPEPKLSADAVLPAPPSAPLLRFTSDKIIALGASTGGTEAIRVVLEALPPDTPGLVIVQHMPELFTAAFAKRLNESCRVEVREAKDRDRVLPGRALIAPGNKHTLVERDGAHYAVRVVDGPPVSRHRPSVDVLFRSLAHAAGPNAVGVILTGMGDDGARGLFELKRAGGRTIAQDEATCVVFGMPREAIQLGAVQDVVPLPQLPGLMLRRARQSRG